MDNFKTKAAAIAAILSGVALILGSWAHGTLTTETGATAVGLISAGSHQLFHLNEQH